MECVHRNTERRPRSVWQIPAPAVPRARRSLACSLARSLVRSALQCRTSITQADRRFGHPASEIFSTHIPPKPRTGVGSGWLGCVCVWELLAMRAMRACRCVAPLGRGRFQIFFVLGVSLGFVARRRACRTKIKDLGSLPGRVSNDARLALAIGR